jgi:hypothetical protein
VPADGASAKKTTEDPEEVVRQRLPFEVAHNHGVTSPPAHVGEYLDRLSFCQVVEEMATGDKIKRSPP